MNYFSLTLKIVMKHVIVEETKKVKLGKATKFKDFAPFVEN